MTRLVYRSYAKVNLTLEVLGRRPDGYHELASLVHTISLADDLALEDLDHDEVVCRAEGLGLGLEADENLVTRAADLLRQTTRVQAGADLRLVKRIPMAAGLGGGSSDAATTLVGLNRLWGTRLGSNELGVLAARLGSDVPFFVRGGAAVLRGRGEQVESLPPVTGQWLALGVPRHSLPDKTARLYAALEEADYSDGTPTQRVARHLAGGGSLLQDADVGCNAFAQAARQEFAGLAAAWRAAEQATGRPFHLSGAGPALFALAADRADARRLAAVLEGLGLPAFASRTVGHARSGAQVAAASSIGYP